MNKPSEFPAQPKVELEEGSAKTARPAFLLTAHSLPSFSASAWRISAWMFFPSIAALWLVYLLVGQQIISALYENNDSWLASRLMTGSALTPVEAYYRRADDLLLRGTLG